MTATPGDALLISTRDGLYCPAGGFHIDPWRPVARAVLTHAHADHARPGSGSYLTAAPGAPVAALRLDAAAVTGLPYGERVAMGEVQVSFHPAGHLLGSAQVRLEHRGQVWVVSGDYKTGPDPTCAPFEPVRCHVFISESTFGLPIYHWPPAAELFTEIDDWWRANQARERTSVLFAYALGKAQRVLAGVDAGIGPVLVHGAVARFLPVYLAAGVALPEVVGSEAAASVRGRGLVVAPPSTAGSPWLRRFGAVSTAFASGWMQVRGNRRRRNLDRGFALSDHADWNGLIQAIRATGAPRVLLTHGQAPTLERWLREHGWDAEPLHTSFDDEGAGEALIEAELESADGAGPRRSAVAPVVASTGQPA
jgi:putative mRNA 3-end processing factor